jgi:hypothetical protein
MGWLKKLGKREMWKRRKLCFFYENDEIIQEWFGADLGTHYIICEVAGLQVCYEVPKLLVRSFMKEKGLGDAELSCA